MVGFFNCAFMLFLVLHFRSLIVGFIIIRFLSEQCFFCSEIIFTVLTAAVISISCLQMFRDQLLVAPEGEKERRWL